MKMPYRIMLLGAELDLVTPDTIMDFLTERVSSGRPGIVANHNLHSLYLSRKSAKMRAFYAKADLIEVDSMPLVAWGKLLGLPISRVHRCTYLDFRDQFWTLVQAKGWRVAHVGGHVEDNAASRKAILDRYPEVQLTVHPGYFDFEGFANALLLKAIQQQKPDILLVGMGMPRQELWILNNLDKLPPCVVLPIGGAFDYEAGVTYTPPRWTGQIGLEWLVRFLHEPRRLFMRYFLEPWHLLPQAFKDVSRRASGQTFFVDVAPPPDEATRKFNGTTSRQARHSLPRF